jgi:hypothetical protein
LCVRADGGRSGWLMPVWCCVDCVGLDSLPQLYIVLTLSLYIIDII